MGTLLRKHLKLQGFIVVDDTVRAGASLRVPWGTG
jgi:hypothetical protein